MVLNPDCMRDCMLTLESKLPVTIGQTVLFNGIDATSLAYYEELSKHSHDEIVYAVYQLADAKLVKTNVFPPQNHPRDRFIVETITFDGHEYLDKIREPKVWNATKKALKGVAGFSVDLVSSVASKVILGIVNQNLDP